MFVKFSREIPKLKSIYPFLCKRFCTVSRTNADEAQSITDYLRNMPSTETFINTCMEYGLPENKLVNTVEKVPDIIRFPNSQIRSNLDQLFELGFENDSVAKIVQNYPYILNYENTDIVETFETWRNCNLHERFLWQLFSENPWLFSISNDEVKMRIKRLHHLLVQKVNRICRILLLCPDLLVADWNAVEEVFVYVIKNLRYTEKDISRTTVLVRPLNYVKLRFTFLERTGVFRRPRLSEEDALVNSFANPRLTNVIDTSDEVFAVYIAKVTLDEYDVFKKLMNRGEWLENDWPEMDMLNMKHDYEGHIVQ